MFYLIHWSWLSVFLFGNYCAIEIDIRIFGTTYTHQFFTRNKGFHNYYSNILCLTNITKVYKVSDSIPRGNNIDIHV
jgi:hypothetical protein